MGKIMPNEKMFSNVPSSETLAECFETFSRNLQGKGSRADGNIFWTCFNDYSCRSRRLGAICWETRTDSRGDTFFGQAHKEPSVGSFNFRFTKISYNCGRSLWRFERLWVACNCRLSLKPAVFFHFEGSINNWFNHQVIELIATKCRHRLEAANLWEKLKTVGILKEKP